MEINPSIFKAYDVRGVYSDELTPEAAYRIGRAFGDYIRITVLNKERDPIIVVNADARSSSPALKEKLLHGLLDEKCYVIDCGLSTTPLHTFAVNQLKADGGVMVTASHNPAEYNGFKLSRRGAEPIGEGSGMEEIRNTALRGIFPVPKEKGSVEEENLQMAYLDYICSLVNVSKIAKMRVAFDVGNGMVGLLLPELLKRLPLEVEILFGTVDMIFPNHEANPVKEETLGDLQKTIEVKEADLGVAFDGDGDRVRFVTSSGLMVRGDITTALFAQYFLRNHSGEKIVFDSSRSSRVVTEIIKEAGGVIIESRVGHTFIKNHMRKENAIFGGEVSGHYYHRDFFFAESALLTLLKLLQILSSTTNSLDELIRPLLRYVTSGEINISVSDKDKALDAMVVHYKDAKEVKYVDGVSIVYENFWFNAQPSNTESLLCITMEAKEKDILEVHLKEVVEIVKNL